MDRRSGRKVDPIWWAPVVLILVGAWFAVVATLFTGQLTSFEPVTLVSDRAGLVMENGAKVRLRGVEIGRVDSIGTNVDAARLQLHIDPGPFKLLPSNVEAEIRSTTAFGSKYVDLIVPPDPSPKPLAPGAVLRSRNVTVEVNTVFENLQSVLRAIDPAKLNAVLSAFADALRGKGERLGQAITAANNVLLAVNPGCPQCNRTGSCSVKRRRRIPMPPRHPVGPRLAVDHRCHHHGQPEIAGRVVALGGRVREFGRQCHRRQPAQPGPVAGPAGAHHRPAAAVFAHLRVHVRRRAMVPGHGGREPLGGNGRSVVMDIALLFGDDPYRYPDNLPTTAAKGGPGGNPSCGSLPDPSANYPVKALVTNTGSGTGLDIRPNPGIGFPGWMDFLPLTRAVPEPPSIRYLGPPAPGPLPPYPGAPPYGAPLYGPDGTPLYPPPPNQPPPPVPDPPAPNPTPAPYHRRPAKGRNVEIHTSRRGPASGHHRCDAVGRPRARLVRRRIRGPP